MLRWHIDLSPSTSVHQPQFINLLSHDSMKLLAVVCLSALTLVGCSSVDPYRLALRQSLPVPHQAVPDEQYTLTEEVKRAAIDMVWQTINERHVDAKLNGVDWQAVRARYEPIILAQKSEEDFCARMIGS
jgi:PBP1b-binding outer membrane lipoprotein LpoB